LHDNARALLPLLLVLSGLGSAVAGEEQDVSDSDKEDGSDRDSASGAGDSGCDDDDDDNDSNDAGLFSPPCCLSYIWLCLITT